MSRPKKKKKGSFERNKFEEGKLVSRDERINRSGARRHGPDQGAAGEGGGGEESGGGEQRRVGTSALDNAHETDAECIEILSDDEEADGAGPSGAIVIGDDDMPKHSTRPTRSSVKLSIPQRIGNIKVIFPHTPAGDGASASTSSIGTVEMSSKDLLTLEDHEFLNDSVIEFFIKSLQHKKMPPEKAARCHIFNSFFYEKLTNVRDERSEAADVRQKKAHQRVEKWTKGVNIFEKDFVFFPIHGNTHWSLMVLCHPGRVQDENAEDGEDMPLGARPTPYLLHMDSMAGGHKSSVVAMKIREYLAMEWLRLNSDTVVVGEEGQAKLLQFDKSSLLHQRMRVPQQDNGCDCGVFLCMFFEKFLEDLPDVISSQDVQAAVRGDASPYSTFMKPGFLRRDWFLPEAALVTRSELMRDILNELERGVPDPDTAREQGADDKTVTTLRNRRFNINTVKDELFDRVYDRTNLLSDMILARKRKKREEEERKNRLFNIKTVKDELNKRVADRTVSLTNTQGKAPKHLSPNTPDANDAAGQHTASNVRDMPRPKVSRPEDSPRERVLSLVAARQITRDTLVRRIEDALDPTRAPETDPALRMSPEAEVCLESRNLFVRHRVSARRAASRYRVALVLSATPDASAREKTRAKPEGWTLARDWALALDERDDERDEKHTTMTMAGVSSSPAMPTRGAEEGAPRDNSAAPRRGSSETRAFVSGLSNVACEPAEVDAWVARRFGGAYEKAAASIRAMAVSETARKRPAPARTAPLSDAPPAKKKRGGGA